MTTIEQFATKHRAHARPIEEIIDRWLLERRIHDFFGTAIFGGITIGDLMIGDRLVDTIPPNVKDAFSDLMGAKAATRVDIERLILEKAHNGRESVMGLMNKIQGQLGEDAFVRAVGPSANLARSGSQEGWDIVVRHHDYTQYVQVKVYQNANQALEALKELQAKIDAGAIHDGRHAVNSIDFAVNSDIYDEVSQKADELGLSTKVLNLDVTHDELRDQLNQAVGHVAGAPFRHFFSEVLTSVGTAAAINAAANAFLVYKGAKESAVAVEDVTYSTLISAGGFLAAHTTDAVAIHALMFAGLEKAAAILSGAPGAVAIFGIGMGARGLLRRIADRRHIARRIEAGNLALMKLGEKIGCVDMPQSTTSASR